MSLFVNQAAKGSKIARIHLYDQNKKMVYFLCLHFLRSKNEAETATRQIFENLWPALDGASDIKLQLLQATVLYCKERLLEKDANAFNPETQNSIPEKMPQVKDGDDPHEMYLNYLLSKLGHLHRFIFLLKSAVGLNNTEVGAFFDIDEIGVNQLMNQAEDAVRSAVTGLKSRKDCPIQNYPHAVLLLQQQMNHYPVPKALSAQIYRNIEQTSTPASKPKWIAIMAACVLLLAATISPLLDYTTDQMGKTYAAIEVDLTNIERFLPSGIDTKGTIVVELDASAAPETVANFIKLADSGFYDGLTFHRVIYDFMIQGGAPSGDTIPDSIPGEFALNGYNNPLSHVRGVISMARLADDYNSASSQFFIMHTNTYTSSLDGAYAAFGWVVSGMDFVDAIAACTYTSDANGSVPAEYQPIISKVTIHKSL